MDNDWTSITFCISEIPDPAFSQFQAVAGGNVSKTIWEGWGHILRTLSNMPASCVSIEIMYVFESSPSQGDSQSRLNIYLTHLLHLRFEEAELSAITPRYR